MKKTTTVKALFRKLIGRVVSYSVLSIVPMVMIVLTVAFLNAERNKLELLTQQMAAVIKPKLQVGDEIEIRGLLTKTLETTNLEAISVTGSHIREILIERQPIKISRTETGYFDALFSSEIVLSSHFQLFPSGDNKFTIQVVFPNTIKNRVIQYTVTTSLIVLVFLFLILLSRLKFAMRRIISPLEELRHRIDQFDQPEKRLQGDEVSSLAETKSVLEKFESLQNRLENQRSALLHKSVEEERGRLADQLGHDLKSHASILLRSIQSLRSQVKEEDILVLQKIAGDIATKMQQLQKFGSESLKEDERSFVIQLAPYIAHLTELKCIEYGHLEALKIRFDFKESDLLGFAKVDPIELGTAISNLVNNSVEAMGGIGEITLAVKRNGDVLSIEILDTGCGIPKPLLEKVRKRGFSTKTGQNRGKGLSKAIELVEKDGGSLTIESEVGIGTNVRLNYLASSPRASCAKQINLNGVKRILVVDNDRDFLQRAAGFLSGYVHQDDILFFRSIHEFQSWISQNSLTQTDFIFMDYDLGEPKMNGLDLISDFRGEPRRLLITHNYTNSRLLDECDKKGVQLLPKILVDVISANATRAQTLREEHYDGAVIEDDELHIFHLRRACRERGLNILFCRSPFEFDFYVNRLDRTTPIIMDSRFASEEIQGEVYSKELFDRHGFKKIILNTGYGSNHFQQLYPNGMYWIERIIEKDISQVIVCLEQASTFKNKLPRAKLKRVERDGTPVSRSRSKMIHSRQEKVSES